MKVSNAAVSQQFDFDTGTLSNSSPRFVNTSSIVDEVPDDGLLRLIPAESGFSLGDGGFPEEDPACAGAGTRTQGKGRLVFELNVPAAMSGIEIYMAGICGLKSRSAKLIL